MFTPRIIFLSRLITLNCYLRVYPTPPTTFERLNRSLWNLVRTSFHLKSSQTAYFKIHRISNINIAVPQIIELISLVLSRDSVACIATSYGLDDRGVGVLVPVGSSIFSSSRLPDRLWGPPSLLTNGYRMLFPGDKVAGAWSLSLTFN
jgi:hypothetical protein